MSNCGLYLIRNTVNGRAYLGSSRDCLRRFSEHRSRLVRGAHVNAKLQAAWLKHGAEAFEFVFFVSVPNPDDLAAVEQFALDDFDSVASGYNLAPTAGNTAGWEAGPETRRRMSEAAKLRDHSAQVKAMAEAARGKKRPQHVLAAMLAGRLTAGTSHATREKMARSARARSLYDANVSERMAAMKDGGANYRAIGASFGVAHTCAIRYVNRWRAEHAAD